MLTCDVSCFAVVRSSVFVPLQNKLHHMDNKAVLILNNRLFMVPHLVRAWSAYKGLNTLILSHTHTHLCRCITGDRLIECITGDGLAECITGDGLIECITGDGLAECITGDGLVECITGDGLVE